MISLHLFQCTTNALQHGVIIVVILQVKAPYGLCRDENIIVMWDHEFQGTRELTDNGAAVGQKYDKLVSTSSAVRSLSWGGKQFTVHSLLSLSLSLSLLISVHQ